MVSDIRWLFVSVLALMIISKVGMRKIKNLFNIYIDHTLYYNESCNNNIIFSGVSKFIIAKHCETNQTPVFPMYHRVNIDI